MKLSRLLAVAIFIMAGFCSCSRDEVRPMDITGEWHLVSDTDGVVENGEIDVYVSFSGNSFELFQKSGSSMRYNRYSGTYSIDGNVLTGKYSNGTDWASGYLLTIENNDILVMESVVAELLCTYRRTAIPSPVRDDAVDTKATNVTADIPFL